jgi:hypothetical protein
MSSKNKIAVLLFIVIASLSLWLYLHNHSGTIPKELYQFEVEDTSSITKIHMTDNNGKEILLEKKKEGGWKLNEKYLARTDAVKNLLTCIKELKVRQPVANSAIENVSKQLATSATKVEIYSGEKLVKKYFVGTDTQDGLGTYMLLTDLETGENSSRPFIMFIPGFNGFLSIRYFMDEDLWRDRTVFAFYPDEISSISIKYTRIPDSSFTISLDEKNNISLSDSKGIAVTDFDTLKAKRYITYYTNINYEALNNDLRKSFKDSALAKGAVHIITLRERNGKVHIVKTYSKPADPNKLDPVTGKPDPEDLERMFALIDENSRDVALIQYYVFGKLFVSADWFRK